MTEEEKFNNWYEENFGKWTEGEELLCPSKDFKEYAEEVYLAGLHEGQPKWHDLRKEPNDLPKDEGKFITSSYLNLIITSSGCGRKEDNQEEEG